MTLRNYKLVRWKEIVDGENHANIFSAYKIVAWSAIPKMVFIVSAKYGEKRYEIGIR